MLKLVNDLMASESGLLTVSVLLYLGAAFDTVVVFAVTHQNVREREREFWRPSRLCSWSTSLSFVHAISW